MADLTVAFVGFLAAGLGFYAVAALGLRIALLVENMNRRAVVTALFIIVAGAVALVVIAQTLGRIR